MQPYKYNSDRFKQWMLRESNRPLELATSDWLYIGLLCALFPICFALGLLIGLIVILTL